MIQLLVFVFFVWACWNIANRITHRDREPYVRGSKPESLHPRYRIEDTQLRQVLGRKTYRELKGLSRKIIRLYHERGDKNG